MSRWMVMKSAMHADVKGRGDASGNQEREEGRAQPDLRNSD
jgi:hypothetical protein